MKNPRAALLVTAAGLTLITAGCASGPTRKPGDPLEPMNRAIFKVNDTLDRTIAQPVARGYQKVTPHPIRQAITNFFSNLGDVNNFANDLLQLKIADAAQDLMRVAINTTFGIGGLIDFATPAKLPKHHQDFGLTLGRWGVPAGPYLVLPLFGPSSVRDSIGRAVDIKFSLLNYVSIDPVARNPLYVTQFVSARADMLGASDLLYQAALDPYSFVRDAYTQQRESALHDGSSANTSVPPPPDYGDPGDPDDPDENGKNGAGAPQTPGAGAATDTPTDPAQAPGAASDPAAANNANAASREGAANAGAKTGDATANAKNADAANGNATVAASAAAQNNDVAASANADARNDRAAENADADTTSNAAMTSTNATSNDATASANAGADAMNDRVTTNANADAENHSATTNAGSGSDDATSTANAIAATAGNNGAAANAPPATNTATPPATNATATTTAMTSITTNTAPTAARALAAPDTGAPVSPAPATTATLATHAQSSPADANANTGTDARQTSPAQTIFVFSAASGARHPASATQPDNATHTASAPDFKDGMTVAFSAPITLSTYRTPQTATYIW